MLDEIADTIDRLRGEFEGLAVRGIRAAGPENIALLKSAREEFERIGGQHMAERIGDVVSTIENQDRAAAAALLRAQTSLRLFDRVLTLQVAEASIAALLEVEDTPDEADQEQDA